MPSLFLQNNSCLYYMAVNLIDIKYLEKKTLSACLLSYYQLLMTCNGVELEDSKRDTN